MDEISPLQYIQLTGCSYQHLADLTGYSYDAVKRWFMKGKSHSNPSPAVPRLLAAELELRRLRSVGNH